MGGAGDLDTAKTSGDIAAILERADANGLAEAWAASHEVTINPPKPSVVEWAEANLKFSERITNLPGTYSTDRTPYVREVLECFKDESVRRISLVWGAQTSKSTAITVGMAYRVANAPGPALWVLSSEDNARKFSESRWMPLFYDNPCLKQHMTSVKDDFKMLQQTLDRMTVWWTGASSPANLASKSIAILCCDELDKYPVKSSRESPPLQLAEARVATYPKHLIITTSTPTLEQGPIWQEWLKGDQRRYFVPCQKCGEKWALEWEHIRWDETAKQDEGWDMQKVSDSVRCVCPSCKHPHTEYDKAAMLSGGEWRATDMAAEPGRRSYHLSSLYATWRKWSELAVKFLQDREAAGGLQDFFNRDLALPWKVDGARITTAMIRERVDASPKYLLGNPPMDGCLVRIMAVDVQQTELWWVVRQLHEDGSSYLVNYGSALGWNSLSEKFREFNCQWGIVDGGYAAKATTGVYNFVFNTAGRFCVSFGRTTKHSATLKPYEWGELQIDGSRTIKQIRFNAPLWQERLYHDVLRDGRVPWHLPRDIAKDYVSQLQNEALVDKNGQSEWQKFGANHIADCEKMALVYMNLFLTAYKAQNPAP